MSTRTALWRPATPLDVLLVFGLLGSSASQFRLEGLPIGIGELCLALWMLLTATHLLLANGLRVTAELTTLAMFWIAFVVVMCMGLMMAYLIGDIHDPTWFWHDVVAYAFVATFSILCVADQRATERMHNVAWMLAVLGMGLLLLQIAVAFELVAFPGIDAWEWDRMRGFTQNSNQLAMFCLLLGFIGLHLAENSSRKGGKAAGLATLVVATITGRLTKSDAFTLALAAALPIFAALKLRAWLLSPWRPAGFKDALTWLLILSVPVLAAATLPLAIARVDEPSAGLRTLLKAGARDANDNSAKLRLQIWASALERAAESGFMGLGPGPHLPIPNEVVVGRRDSTTQGINNSRPFAGIAPNFEAHNTVLDLLMQGGVLVLLDCALLALLTVAIAIRARADAITALLGGLAIFSLFHFTFRQPTLWFALTFCLVAAADVRRSRARS